MSNVIKTKLEAVYNELEGAKRNIEASKVDIAEALRFNGITNVSDTETFARYAELIRRLKSANAMVFEFDIPSTATTTYKRTVVLPMYFGTDGNIGATLNTIAKELIAMDPATVGHYPEDPDEETKEPDYSEHLIQDVYGNTIMDGNFTIPMNDIDRYLTEEQAQEFLNAAENLGYNVSEYGISTMAENPDGNFEPSTEAMYSYTVDWGDGTGEFIFDETKTYEENKQAIWHTYAEAGVYDVTINGTYKRIITQGHWNGSFIEDGEYVRDSDGTILTNLYNYGMTENLIAVIAWGNTLLNNMSSAFRMCKRLASIPMYDTTNSFVDVTTFQYAFSYCTSLKSLPFNTNTNRGLFSGCEKATDFSYTFVGDTGLTEPIPIKLIDGCTNVTTVAAMFAECPNMEGSIPTGMFAGLTKLTNAAECFSGNKKMNGELSSDLFKDCPNITNIGWLFNGCTQITGRITRDFMGGLSKLTNMRKAFYGCKGITGIDSDAFYNLKSDGINCRDAFYGSGITEIPNGLLESLTGKNLSLERMFGNCVDLTSISATSLANLKVAGARGIFGGCTSLSSACPDNNADWDSYEGIQRWYGAFAKTNLSDIDTVCVELGGDGDRKFSEGKVGAIVLKDGTTVEVKDYTYSASNVPVGIVYADVYLDPAKTVSTIANSQGNVVSSDFDGALHRVYVTVFNDGYKAWSVGQAEVEDITTITNTSNVEVGYNSFTWNEDGTAATRNVTRYCGEPYSDALNQWRVDHNMATYSEESGYVKTSTDKYDAIDFINTYNIYGEGHGEPGSKSQVCFFGDGADLWDQFVMKYMVQKACDKIIAGGGGYTSGNCYSLRDDNYYWLSAEGSSSSAWRCGTANAYLYYYYGKWYSYFVRPAFALDVLASN